MFLALKLSSFERHHTRIKRESSLAHKLFLTQFINTALTYLVATSYISRISNFVKKLKLENFLFVGIFFDTTPTWY